MQEFSRRQPAGVVIKASYLLRSGLYAVAFLTPCVIYSDCSIVPKTPVMLHCPDTPIIHSGEATFYDYVVGSGSCSFDSTDTASDDSMVGAMNQYDYLNSQICGACLSVTGPRATILIRIVDLCPGCVKGGIDLSPNAFLLIADTSQGRVPITWHVVAYNAVGAIVYHFKAESSQWWTAVQIRNHRYPIYSLEYQTPENNFKQVSRVDYNYFVEQSGMGRVRIPFASPMFMDTFLLIVQSRFSRTAAYRGTASFLLAASKDSCISAKKSPFLIKKWHEKQPCSARSVGRVLTATPKRRKFPVR